MLIYDFNDKKDFITNVFSLNFPLNDFNLALKNYQIKLQSNFIPLASLDYSITIPYKLIFLPSTEVKSYSY